MRLAKAVLVLIAVILSVRASAQGYRGTDFWICFPQNAINDMGSSGLEQTLFISSDYRTGGVIQPQDDSISIPFNVESGATVSIRIDTTYELTSSSQIERRSLHVTSVQPITLYVVSHRKASTDSYAAIPTSMLGTSYVIAGYTTFAAPGERYTLSSQADIVATEDNTMVTAVLSGSTADGLPAGRTVSLPMNKGDVFQLKGGGTVADLTGTIVTSTKPIAFVTGHRCAQVPQYTQFCDMLMEMEPPANDWGKDFIATHFEGKTGYVLRVIAKDDSTQVILNGRVAAELNKAGYFEIDTLRSDAIIHTSNPVLVGQYSTSAEADTEKIGDPFMLLLVPNDRFIMEATMTSVEKGMWRDYVNIVVPDSALNSIHLDGQPLKTGNARHIGKFAVVPYELTSGSHSIVCPIPIALYSYGFGVLTRNYDSYGHTCGMRLDETNRPK
jgi:hypothetical protein